MGKIKAIYEKSYLGKNAYKSLLAMEKFANVEFTNFIEFDKEKDFQINEDYDGFILAVDYRPYQFAYVCTYQRSQNV